jgi:hypothetical protein
MQLHSKLFGVYSIIELGNWNKDPVAPFAPNCFHLLRNDLAQRQRDLDFLMA